MRTGSALLLDKDSVYLRDEQDLNDDRMFPILQIFMLSRCVLACLCVCGGPETPLAVMRGLCVLVCPVHGLVSRAQPPPP